MLKAEHIAVNYGKSRIVTNVSFEVKQKDRLVILGRNGVGKTTLLKSLIGILPLKDGKLYLEEKDISRLKTYERSRSGIAYVPQGREIIPQLTVKENLQMGAVSHGVDYEKKAEEIFSYFPALTQHLKRKEGFSPGDSSSSWPLPGL